MTQPIASLPQRRRIGARLLATWLLLTAIVGHAVLPVGSPLQRASGSAFSAGTVEVTTLPGRKQRAEATAAAESGDKADQPAGSGTGLPAANGWNLEAPPRYRAEVPLAGAGPPNLPRLHFPQQARAPPLS